MLEAANDCLKDQVHKGQFQTIWWGGVGGSKNSNAATLRASWTKRGPLVLYSPGIPCSSPLKRLTALIGFGTTFRFESGFYFFWANNFLYPSHSTYFEIQKLWVDAIW